MYRLYFAGDFDLHNDRKIYRNRDDAVLNMTTIKDAINIWGEYDIQNEYHDLDGHIESMRFFKNGVYCGIIQIVELEVIGKC